MADFKEAASALNETLQRTATDAPGGGSVEQAFNAGRIFYEELSAATPAERRFMVDAALTQNRALSSGDPAMPRLEITMDPDSFVEGVKIAYPLPFPEAQSAGPKSAANGYWAEQFTYDGLGMTTDAPVSSPDFTGQEHGQGFEIELPSLSR